MTDKYDITIIGSGLGGLVCGYILSKEGHRVCILEKNKQIGGCLQTFKREGCIFDTGMHYIGSLDKGQILHRFFNYFGLNDKLKVKRLDQNAFDLITFNGKEYPFAMGHDNFAEKLLRFFPKEKAGLAAYTGKLKEISSTLNLYNLREVEGNSLIDNEYIQSGAYDFIRSCTNDVTLQNVLAGTNSLYGGVAEKSPLYMHALISNFFIESAYRLVDGSDQLALLLAESIVQQGGVILKNHEVIKFLFNNGGLTSVELKNGEKIESKTFISNVHPARTLTMIDPEHTKKAYRNRISSLTNTVSSFSLYITLKEQSFPYINSNIYYVNDDVWKVADYTEQNWPKGFMLITPATSKSEKWADCINIVTYMKYDDVKKWENTTVEKRGDDYLQFKKEKTEKLISLVEKRFPGIRAGIKTCYSSTPLTYRDYTYTQEGSLYGIQKDYNAAIQTYIPPKTNIPNLYLTGQNINLHGILGVIIGSMLTCAEYTGLNNLIRKINAVQ